jgi:hypothetical protein
MQRFTLLTVVAAALIAAGAVAAVATPGVSGGAASARAGSPTGNVGVTLNVSKFVKSGNRLVAKGTATATYKPESGTAKTVSKPFTARVTVAKPARTLSGAKAQAACPVLTLQIDQVSLDLLGLHVDLSKVVLTITANAQGGVLGKLFCNLSSGQLATASTAHALSSVSQQSGMSTKGVTFGTATPQALGPGPCSIVDLLLGPLHLDLLGLIVDLNQIHLQITADPNGGILGSLLCSIAPPPTTAAVTTAAP